MAETIQPLPLPSDLSQGTPLYLRKSYLVVWSTDHVVTCPPWGLYWCPLAEQTMVRVYDKGPRERAWLPLPLILGHWDWYTGCVDGYRVRYGWGPAGPERCRYEYVVPSELRDPDTGHRYWLSSRLRPEPDPMSHY